MIRRVWNNLSQKQLANLIGVKQGSIEQYENDRSLARIPALRKLSLLVGVTIDDLIFKELLTADISEAPLQKPKKQKPKKKEKDLEDRMKELENRVALLEQLYLNSKINS